MTPQQQRGSLGSGCPRPGDGVSTIPPYDTEALAAEVERLRGRDEAWKQLVRWLHAESGMPPDWQARGLWVDLFDEVVGS